MTESIAITTERVDDLPLLLTHLRRMDIPSLLEQHFHQHGNWQGLNIGWVASIWLAYVLSEGDHRLNHVQPWASTRLLTLQASTAQPVQSRDLTDDRLASLLHLLSDDAAWISFERALTRTTLRVYDLQPSRIRLDSTTSSGYWSVTEDGLFQFGHSKDHRPDLPQLKVMLATLDPLGMPVATDILSGERADDLLYLPAIHRVRNSLAKTGLLYVGDCKMASLATRTGVAFQRDFYLCPLSAVQVPPAVLAGYVADVIRGEHNLRPINRPGADGQNEQIAEGFELTETLTAEHDTWEVQWSERRLVVRSLQQARTAERALHTRLDKAQQALAEVTKRGRGKRPPTDLVSVEQAVAAIVTRYQVGEVLRVSCRDEVQERPVRAYGKRLARVERTSLLRVTWEVDQAGLATVIARLGWRVYVTNQEAEQLSLEQAVLAYREEYIIERSMGRLKGYPLSLQPMYLERDDHATGLVRLLSLGLRVLTLLEGVARRHLAAEGTKVAGLYAGQPTRTTTRPTTERVLAGFREITLTIVALPGRVVCHVTPLTALQQRLLELVDCSPEIYERLARNSSDPP